MKRFVVLVGLFLLVGLVYPQDKDGGIIYGPDWAYLISAPDGYKMDNRSLQRKGIWGLFYKKEQEQYQASKLNMYINPFMKGGDYPDDVDSLIRWDIGYFLDNNPGLVASYYRDIELGDFSVCKIFKLDDDSRQYYMLHGYVTEEKSSFVFVLVARSKEEREQNEKSYEELLKSFVYMAKE